MVDVPHNPYSPPREQGVVESPVGNAPRRNLLLEVARAFATILGIMVGWIIVGAGFLKESTAVVFLGVIVIGLACVIGLSSAQRRRKKPDA